MCRIREAVVERLLPFDVVCVMRERTPLPREIIRRLPRLKLIASTGTPQCLDRHVGGAGARHHGDRDALRPVADD